MCPCLKTKEAKKIKSADFLTEEQTCRLFRDVLELSINSRRCDYDTFQGIIRVLDPVDPKKITKTELIEFFLLNDGYRQLSDLKRENR